MMVNNISIWTHLTHLVHVETFVMVDTLIKTHVTPTMVYPCCETQLTLVMVDVPIKTHTAHHVPIETFVMVNTSIEMHPPIKAWIQYFFQNKNQNYQCNSDVNVWTWMANRWAHEHMNMTKYWISLDIILIHKNRWR